MNATSHNPRWQTLLAYAIIYIVWGSTFYAIRVGVREVPPLLFAAMRFLTAGVVLFSWLLARRERSPNARECASVLLLAFLIFVVDYGSLFWAEQTVPSGLAAVMFATIPAFMALAEIVLLRTQKLTLRLAVALAVGIAGVAVLVSPSLHLGGATIGAIGAAVLLLGSMSWSVASVLTRKLPLPASKSMRSGAQMLAGGAMLAVASLMSGEIRGFHPSTVSAGAWFALAYLVFVGSMIGFTAYIWLLHHEPPTRVATYAYVNPVIAILIGYFLGGEALGLRTVLGAACILASVALITTTPKRIPAPAPVGARD